MSLINSESQPARPPYLVAISGGSCSGKTTLARYLKSELGEDVCDIVYQDSYYHDLSAQFDQDGGRVNFDHPSSIDFDLLATHLQNLKKCQPIEIPIYDFVTHQRQQETVLFRPHPIVLVDGILLLSQSQIRPLFDWRLFVVASKQARLERRKIRDCAERGRSVEGVIAQFENHVEPMHQKYVSPSQKYAEKVIDGNHELPQVLEHLSSYLKKI